MGIYNEFFNLKVNPFDETPDRRFFYRSTSHHSVLTWLKKQTPSREPVSLVVGEVGTGKTLLTRVLLNQASPNIQTALIMNCILEPNELFHKINRELGAVDLLKSLRDDLYTLDLICQRAAIGNHPILIVIDEAQSLPVHTLKALLKWTNYAFKKQFPVITTLFGQSELLSNSNLTALPTVSLAPLSERDFSNYINHRLFVSGGTGFVRFLPDALVLIFKLSGGLPRLINRYCEQCLQVAERLAIRNIDKRTVQRVLTEDPTFANQHSFPQFFTKPWGLGR